MKKTIFLKAMTAILLVLAVPACAYVLQGRHLVTLMVRTLGSPGPMTVEQRVTVHRQDPQAEPVTFDARDHYLDTHRFRSDAQVGGGRTLMVTGFASLVVLDSKISGTRQAPHDLYKDLLLYRTRSQMEQRLSQMGVDLAVSSLGYTETATVYIIGARFPDLSVPQVWLDKARLLPVRWILAAGEQQREILYEDWRQAGKRWHPHRIRFFENGTLTREIAVTAIDASPAFADDFFDLEYLKSIFPPDAPGGRSESETLESEEVHRRVDDFNEVFE